MCDAVGGDEGALGGGALGKFAGFFVPAANVVEFAIVAVEVGIDEVHVVLLFFGSQLMAYEWRVTDDVVEGFGVECVPGCAECVGVRDAVVGFEGEVVAGCVGDE